MEWYALYTSSRAEKRVEKRLQEAGVVTYLPLHTVKRKWSDRVKVVSTPLFNSYIFVKCTDHQVRNLPFTIYGVSKVIYYNGKPAIIRECEIDAIKEFVTLAEGRKVIAVGDDVEIISGPFEKRRGEVLTITNDTVKLTLEEIGLNICISLQQLEKEI